MSGKRAMSASATGFPQDSIPWSSKSPPCPCSALHFTQVAAQIFQPCHFGKQSTEWVVPSRACASHLWHKGRQKEAVDFLQTQQQTLETIPGTNKISTVEVQLLLGKVYSHAPPGASMAFSY